MTATRLLGLVLAIAGALGGVATFAVLRDAQTSTLSRVSGAVLFGGAVIFAQLQGSRMLFARDSSEQSLSPAMRRLGVAVISLQGGLAVIVALIALHLIVD